MIPRKILADIDAALKRMEEQARERQIVGASVREPAAASEDRGAQGLQLGLQGDDRLREDGEKGAESLRDEHDALLVRLGSIGLSEALHKALSLGLDLPRNRVAFTHDDSSTRGRSESVTLHITVEVPKRGGGDSRPCACGGAK